MKRYKTELFRLFVFTNYINMNKNSEVQTNGNGFFKHFGERKQVAKDPNFWRRVEFNEWTFSLLLFVFSLIIVVSKLTINYGEFMLFMNKMCITFSEFLLDSITYFRLSLIYISIIITHRVHIQRSQKAFRDPNFI